MTVLSDAPARGSTPLPPRTLTQKRLVRAAGLLIALGGGFFYFATRSNLWLDEALSVNIARLPLSDLRSALEHDGAPPLYYFLLHIWTAVFGTGAFAVRSLSGLCMACAVVVLWFAARRLGGRPLAWLAAMVMVVNPYAYRYATEARMYALEILLVTCGLLVCQRMFERPSWMRAAPFGVIVALLVYTQYWAFYLLVVVVALFAGMWWRNVHRDATRQLLIAISFGVLTFAPWLPTFLVQRAHTGTPWGTPVLPGVPLADTLRDFAGGASGTSADRQEAWLLFLVLIPLLLLGVFGRAVDARKIEIDVRTQPEIRGIAFVGGIGLIVALTLNYLAGGAFQSRYSAIVFPFFVLLVARGLTTLRDPRVLAAAGVVVVLLGLAGGGRNFLTQRTQAGEVARVLRAEAHPNDVVVYCPDQVAPAVHRLTQKGLTEIAYASPVGPTRVDWYDYKKRIAHTPVGPFAQASLARAQGHTLWYVSAPGYTTHRGICEALADAYGEARPRLQRTLSDDRILEKPALIEFPRRG